MILSGLKLIQRYTANLINFADYYFHNSNKFLTNLHYFF